MLELGDYQEWSRSETIIRNGLPPALVVDPLFRKTLVTTSKMGQTSVCMVKGTALGKRDTTLPHRHTFTRKMIPVTDKRLDEENMARLIDKEFVDWIDRQTNTTKDKVSNLNAQFCILLLISES